MASRDNMTGSPYPADIISGGSTMAPGQKKELDRKRRDFDAAFALKDDVPQVGLEQASKLCAEENRDLRWKIIAGALIFTVLFFGSLCIKPSLGGGFMNPLDVLEALAMHVTMPLQALLGNPSPLTYSQIVEQYPAYYQVESRFAVSLVTAVCGLMLALAGSLYQMVFKNPIAAPTMLGVSNGVSLGVLVFVLIFQGAALQMDTMRCAFSYAGAIIVLLLVLMLTKAICGKGRTFSVFELLLVGSIFSQVCGSIVQVVQDTVMTDELWEVYIQVSEAMNSVIGPFAIISVGLVALLTVIPVFLMRYSINTISYSDLEARLMGLDANVLKVACLVLGTVMVTIAQVNVGTVAMVSLIVPFISRAVFGTEFKHQFWGDLLLGAILLLLCRDLVLLVPFYGMELTMGTVVSFVTLPFYVWIIASKQRGWK